MSNTANGENIPIPDEHYCALGKVADAWADLEFDIDQLLWKLMRTEQALGACVTAQMFQPSAVPRIPRKLDEAKQKAFIASYDSLLNSLGDDEAVLFADAVHPTHAARPVGCWAPEQEKLAIEQTSGRQRINVHGAIDLETGRTRMIEVETVDAVSTIRLLESIEAFYPMLALIHVFLDNARYHHAKLVQDWLSRPDCRIRLHFIPAYCPHLNPIERLWGVMHKHVTHNKCYATCSQFADATLGFLRETVPRNWANLCNSVTDNFRVISPKDFRVMA